MEKWCPGVTLIVDGGDNATEGHGEMVIWMGKRGEMGEIEEGEKGGDGKKGERR